MLEADSLATSSQLLAIVQGNKSMCRCFSVEFAQGEHAESALKPRKAHWDGHPGTGSCLCLLQPGSCPTICSVQSALWKAILISKLFNFQASFAVRATGLQPADGSRIHWSY